MGAAGLPSGIEARTSAAAAGVPLSASTKSRAVTRGVCALVFRVTVILVPATLTAGALFNPRSAASTETWMPSPAGPDVAARSRTSSPAMPKLARASAKPAPDKTSGASGMGYPLPSSPWANSKGE